jgi:hypothetical protein
MPNGRLPSPSWRLVAVCATITIGLLAFLFATLPGWLFSIHPVVDPLGVHQEERAKWYANAYPDITCRMSPKKIGASASWQQDTIKHTVEKLVNKAWRSS